MQRRWSPVLSGGSGARLRRTRRRDTDSLCASASLRSTSLDSFGEVRETFGPRTNKKTMKDVTQKRYTAEFKSQAVELVGIGKPVSEVARDLKISEGVLYEWVRKSSQAAQLGSEGR